MSRFLDDPSHDNTTVLLDAPSRDTNTTVLLEPTVAVSTTTLQPPYNNTLSCTTADTATSRKDETEACPGPTPTQQTEKDKKLNTKDDKSLGKRVQKTKKPKNIKQHQEIQFYLSSSDEDYDSTTINLPSLHGPSRVGQCISAYLKAMADDGNFFCIIYF